MTNTINRVILFAMIVGMIALTAMVLTRVSYGSVEYAGAAYQATSTRTAVVGAALTSPTTLATRPGVFGSIIITGANTGVINIYDGTTTLSHSDHATTTLAVIPASTAVGTYVFDLEFKRGLIYELQTGLAPTSTITWKQ